MHLERLDRIKQRLLAKEDHAAIAQDFLYDVMADEGFLDLGSFVESPLLEGVIRETGRKLFGVDEALEIPAFLRIETANFMHGAFTLGGRVANVIYFSDVGIGILSIVSSTGPESKTDIVRFAACDCREPHDENTIHLN